MSDSPLEETPIETLSHRETRGGGIPIYPLVFAAFPVLSTFAANLAYFPANQAVRPLAVAVVGAALLTLVLSLALRSTVRGGAAAAVFVIAFGGYSWFTSRIPLGLPHLAPWGVLTLLAMALVAWKAPPLRPLNVAATILLAVTLGNLGLSIGRARQLSAKGVSGHEVGSTFVGPKPDVFYIILDAHGRADALQRTMGYDERPFVDGLRERGFYVADKSRSNYCQTELSIPSSMNMDYISDLLPQAKPDVDDRSPLPTLLDHSAVERGFRAQGYEFLAVTSGFAPIRFPSADQKFDNESGMTLVERMLFELTPLATPKLAALLPSEAGPANPFPNQSRDNVAAGHRRRITLNAFRDLRALAKPTVKPRFVVAHILAPHPPFVFGPNGEPADIGKYHGIADFEIFYENVGNRADYRKGYTGQVAFIDKMTLAAIDEILKAAGPRGRPVIIVQGDHGSRMNASFHSSGRTDVTECFENLAAFLAPDSVKAKLWDDITPVNEFRVVFDGLFGERLPILPERSLYSGSKYLYRFTDATPYVQRTTPTSEYGKPLSFKE